MNRFNSNKGQMALHLPQDLIIDNFAGGGGASTGMELAFGRPVDIAINHDPEAISMHKVNHPNTEHYCESVWDIDPRKVCKGRPVAAAWFSPDCKHFSKAKGGTPVEKKIRGLAWVAMRWAATVRPRIIFLENVEEFVTWGPLCEKKRPCPKNKGRTFRSFVNALKRHGYDVEWRELSACDYGAPTTRKRFFLIARCDGQPISWPEPTHAKPDSVEVKNGSLLPYRTAAECIDWSIPVTSIFNRKKELAEKTKIRIARGIKKFILEAEKPFVVPAASVAPFITECANGSSQRNMSIDEPLRTITAQTKGGTFAVVTPIIERQFGNSAGNNISAPLGTTTTRNKSGLVAAFLAKHYGGNYSGAGVNLKEPLHAVTTKDHHALVTSNLVKLRNNNTGVPVTDPIPTITAGGNHIGEVRAFLLKYYGTNIGHDAREPLQTITTKHRFGLVTIRGEDYQIVDIGMRMLEPHELYKAQSFPDDYQHTHTFEGKKLSKAAQVRMCGNSVCPELARAIVSANIEEKRQEKVA